jgi:hypothetical protein
MGRLVMPDTLSRWRRRLIRGDKDTASQGPRRADQRVRAGRMKITS